MTGSLNLTVAQFETTARAHASLNVYWLSHSLPTNFEKPLASCIVGPDGHVQARSKAGSGDLAFATIEPNSERWEIPLRKARPWRDDARKGDIYTSAGVKDPRSEDKNNF